MSTGQSDASLFKVSYYPATGLWSRSMENICTQLLLDTLETVPNIVEKRLARLNFLLKEKWQSKQRLSESLYSTVKTFFFAETAIDMDFFEL